MLKQKGVTQKLMAGASAQRTHRCSSVPRQRSHQALCSAPAALPSGFAPGPLWQQVAVAVQLEGTGKNGQC